MTSRGRSFELFRSKMTSDGCFSLMRGSAISNERSKKTGAPSPLAAVEILTEKIRSSTRQSTIVQTDQDGHECSAEGERCSSCRCGSALQDIHDSRSSRRSALLQEWIRRGVRTDARS